MKFNILLYYTVLLQYFKNIFEMNVMLISIANNYF
jgi:hypothetical protein